MVKRFLSVVSLGDARRALSGVPVRWRETLVPLGEAVGLVTARPLFAAYSVPGEHLAAMDGICVRSADTAGASEQSPVVLMDAVPVNTGNVIPPGYDAVIMVEEVWREGDAYLVRRPASPWQNIRPPGEDIAESEMILPSGHRVRPQDVGALATYGITHVPVRSFRAGLIPTGNELVQPGTRPGPGQVVESNTRLAEAFLSAHGGVCTRYPPVRDDPALIREALARAAGENDLVIVSAGSSAGTRDFTAEVISELGEVIVHGVAMKPGKPVIVGAVGQVPVIGLPGYPLSALTVLREIVAHLLTVSGIPVFGHSTVEARLASTLPSEAGVDEFVLVACGNVRGEWVAIPLPRGSGIQMSAVRSNGHVCIPASVEGYRAGEKVDVHLATGTDEARAALVVTGSHDPALDWLADMLACRGTRVFSAHAGSMGGLLALRGGYCHAAPVHLLSESGEYNVPFIEKYLPGMEVELVCVAEREQGIISRTGLSLDEIPGKTFVNRQKGSGTRILLDFELARRGISPRDIPGYGREVTTHTAVALAVKNGQADAAMGIRSAARAFGLSFVPVAHERYELAVPADMLGDPRVEALLGAVASAEFRAVLERMGGYRTDLTGTRRRVRAGTPPPDSRRQ
ncbi:MAG: molybdopterin biosynthesis protein [Methanolinea sp.]|nr:molybdopterin biosynthesis protein [Methanolinea sp.]